MVGGGGGALMSICNMMQLTIKKRRFLTEEEVNYQEEPERGEGYTEQEVVCD